MQQFRSHVAGSAATCEKIFSIRIIVVCEAEIGNADVFDVIFVAENKVFWFDVPVEDSLLMDVGDCVEEFVDNLCAFVFGEGR